MFGQFRIRRYLGQARKSDEIEESRNGPTLGCCIWRGTQQDERVKVKIEPQYRIRTFRRETLFGHPLQLQHYVTSYLRLKEFFGVRFSGFVNILKYNMFASFIGIVQKNPSNLKYLREANGGSRDCINFLIMRIAKDRSHTAACLYRPFHSTATIFESQLTSDVIHQDYAEIITRYHGPNVRIQYAKGFPHQWDRFSCSYHALWACICILANPTEYDIDVVETYKFVKLLLECPKEVKKMSIGQIWDKVSTKK